MCFNFHKPPFATGVLVPPRGVLKHSWIVFPGSWKEPWANSSLRSNKVGTSESWREGEKEVSASTNRGGTIFSSTWTGHIKRKALHFLPSSVLWITRFSARMWWEVHLQHPWWSQQFNIRIVNWNGLQLPVQGRIVPATDTTSDSQQTNQGNAWLWQKSRKKKKIFTACAAVCSQTGVWAGVREKLTLLSAHSACPGCPHFPSSASAQGPVGLLRTEQDNTGVVILDKTRATPLNCSILTTNPLGTSFKVTGGGRHGTQT